MGLVQCCFWGLVVASSGTVQWTDTAITATGTCTVSGFWSSTTGANKGIIYYCSGSPGSKTWVEVNNIGGGSLTVEADPVASAINGILKSNGTTISAAVAGTDYVIPAGNVATATALAANPTDCSANQYATTIAANGNLTCAGVTGGQVTGAVATSTALAANGANCSSGSFPLGVDASGASESCTAVSSLNSGTATALAANGSNCSAGSFPLGVDASGASESCTALSSSNAGTATALAANGSNCSAGSYPLGVDASGNVESCTVAGGGSSAFSAITGSTNTTAAMVVGSGASLGVSGSGTIAATSSSTSLPLAGGGISGAVTFPGATPRQAILFDQSASGSNSSTDSHWATWKITGNSGGTPYVRWCRLRMETGSDLTLASTAALQFETSADSTNGTDGTWTMRSKVFTDGGHIFTGTGGSELVSGATLADPVLEINPDGSQTGDLLVVNDTGGDPVLEVFANGQVEFTSNAPASAPYFLVSNDSFGQLLSLGFDIQLGNAGTGDLVIKSGGDILLQGQISVQNNAVEDVADPTNPQDADTLAARDAGIDGKIQAASTATGPQWGVALWSDPTTFIPGPADGDTLCATRIPAMTCSSVFVPFSLSTRACSTTPVTLFIAFCY